MPGEPSTRRGRASRERIVARAAELFALQGIAATTVDEVLAAAGAGKGQFYHYFSSRDELAAAAVGHRCTQVVAGLTEALGGVSSLAGLEEALARFMTGPDAGALAIAEFPAPAEGIDTDRGPELRCYIRDPDGHLIEVGQRITG
jgi:AcrR family transcriptional regulator